MFSVHTTLEEFENGDFTLKTHQMFSVHTTREEFENATITGHFGFEGNVGKVIEKKAGVKKCWFKKLCFRYGKAVGLQLYLLRKRYEMTGNLTSTKKGIKDIAKKH